MSVALNDIFFEIIVVEDEPITRMRLLNILEGQGHPVRVYSNGREAWEAFDQSPARVVISDWLMPEMNGPELCRRIRERPETDYTYFIIITGERINEADYEDAITAGTDDFLIKPITRASLWRRLRVAKRLLGFTKQIRQLEELIPICMYCKQVRDDPNYWRSLEEYVHCRTGSRFTHGVCPSCYDGAAREMNAQLNALTAIAAELDAARQEPPTHP
jgi:CheY-like chemotaxis protein